MNVEFCEDNSGTSKKCAISEKISWIPGSASVSRVSFESSLEIALTTFSEIQP